MCRVQPEPAARSLRRHERFSSSSKCCTTMIVAARRSGPCRPPSLDHQEPLPSDDTRSAARVNWEPVVPPLPAASAPSPPNDGPRSTPTRMTPPSARHRTTSCPLGAQSRPRAAGRGHLPVAAIDSGNAAHKLDPARVSRLVRQPAAVGETNAVPLGERRLHERRHAAATRRAPSASRLARLWSRVGKISRRPSGEMAVADCWLGLSLSRSIAPVSSAACPKRLRTPARSELKTTRRPSGVHTG